VLGDVLAPHSRALFTGWLLGCRTGFNRLRAGLPKAWAVGDKTGHNGKDAAGDIAVAWPKPDTPILIAAYTRGGTPTDAQHATVFAAIGRTVAARLAR
jgi:beta-lactamase class A